MSENDSPFFTDDSSRGGNCKTCAPSLKAADSKDILVLVLGSKNNVAMIFPFKKFNFSSSEVFSIFFAISSISSISSLLMSFIEIMSFIFFLPPYFDF